MPPTRTSKPRKSAEQEPTAGPSKKSSTYTKKPSNDGTAVPGVQKIKASLRQTRRLLAKDTLAPDTRVETERRLKALEAELVQAEVNRKEKAFAVKYHKIKFFERKKITRRITQTKSRLTSADEGSEEVSELESKLQDLRVDLNYILHYPKDQRYISLLPPDTREEGSKPSAADSSKTDEQREAIRTSIRARMKEGELPSKPEEESSHPKTSTAAKASKKVKGATTESPPAAPARPEDDDFFASEDESE